MAHTYHLEIKTFTISPANKRNKLSAEEIGSSIFGLADSNLNETNFISSFKDFVEDGFNNLKDNDGFITNDNTTKKLKIVELFDNSTFNSFVGVYIGGTIGEKGKFNKKRNGKYQSEILGPDDFTDIPFLFYIHFPINSSVGVIMLYKTSARSMSQEIKAIIKEIFFKQGFSLRYQNFISENQKEHFKSFSTVEKIVISQNVRGGAMDDKYTFFDKGKEYRVKIEISGIEESAGSYFSRIFKKRKKNKFDKTATLFPAFKDLGIDNEKASIKTIIKEDGGNRATPDFKDYDTYFDKLLTKINLGEKSSVEYSKGVDSFEYTELLEELNAILEFEVWPTLNKENESE